MNYFAQKQKQLKRPHSSAQCIIYEPYQTISNKTQLCAHNAAAAAFTVHKAMDKYNTIHNSVISGAKPSSLKSVHNGHHKCDWG